VCVVFVEERQKLIGSILKLYGSELVAGCWNNFLRNWRFSYLCIDVNAEWNDRCYHAQAHLPTQRPLFIYIVVENGSFRD